MLVDFFIKKDFITVIPIEKTFFITIDFTSNAKLSYESVLFNYQNLSPFKNSALSYIQKDEKLMLWFYEKSYRHVFSVPEGFLYYHFFIKHSGNVLVTIEDKVTFVMQDGILVYQSLCVEPLCEDKELLSKKYNIKDVINKSIHWHQANQKKIINRSLYLLIKYFVDKKMFVSVIKDRLSSMIIPIAIFLGIMTAIHAGINQYLQEDLVKFNQQRDKTKKEVKDIFQGISENRSSIALLENYQRKYSNFDVGILVLLSSVVKKEGAYIYHYIHNEKFITVRLVCKDIESFLEKLSKIKQIESYKLTRQMKTKDSLHDITLEISIKKDKE